MAFATDDGYIIVGRSRGLATRPGALTKPSLRKNKIYVQITQEVFEEVGSPELVIVYFNPSDQLIKLVKAGDKEAGVKSYKVNHRKYVDGSLYHTFRLSEDSSLQELIEALPDGYYVSIGGGVYKYHGVRPPLK